MKTMTTLLLLGLTTGWLAACGTDGAEDFREAVPSRAQLSLDVPTPTPAASEPGKKSSALLGVRADLYQLTHDVSRKVNTEIWIGLQIVDSIVAHAPTKVTADAALWGPLGDALEPLTWTLAVQRKGLTTYDYVLAARPRTSTGDFTPILAGRSTRWPTGFTGVYTANADALRALDPNATHKTGKLVATYDTRLARRTVHLALEGYTNDLGATADALYRYLRRADRSGELRFVTWRDMQDNGSAPELFAVSANWDASGAGRGDAVITAGDVPAGEKVLITECWDAGFGRVFYEDSINFSPTEGSAAQCAFSTALP